MLIIGLLYGEGDFAKTICTAVNCGEDTDCTAATAGSIFGILHGSEAIPEQWIAPIGRKIKTACLNLGELGYFGAQLPQTVDELTERTLQVARQMAWQRHLPLQIRPDAATDWSGATTESLMAGDLQRRLQENANAAVFRFDFFDIAVDYGYLPTIMAQTPKVLIVRLRNTYKVQANLNLRWYLPEGWTVSPSPVSVVFCPPRHLGPQPDVEFKVTADRVDRPLHRLVLEVTIDGRPTVMLVPITLLNGSLTG